MCHGQLGIGTIFRQAPGCSRLSSGILWTVKWYWIQLHLIMFYSLKTMLSIWSWRGVNWCHLVSLSTRWSARLWTESCPLCIFHNTSQIHFIFTHHINQLQKVCRVLSHVQNYKIQNFVKFFKFATFTLSMWIFKVDFSSKFLLQQLLIFHDDTSRWFKLKLFLLKKT